MASSEYEYDVFVSHAVEDKVEIANELVQKLQDSGILVWYSSQRLSVGRGVEETIREGLDKSRHGIVILTQTYFSRDWPIRELNALWNREHSRILPVWHKITKEEIKKHDKTLADLWALDSKNGIDTVVRELVRHIQASKTSNKNDDIVLPERKINTNLKPKHAFYILSLLALVSIVIWFFLIRDVPTNELINSTVQTRVDSFQKRILNDHLVDMNKKGGIAATSQQVIDYYDQYESIKSHYRNEYNFSTGYADFNFKKNVEPALGIDLGSLSPSNDYGFTYPNIFVIDHFPSEHTMDIKCIFINSQPVDFKVLEGQKTEDEQYIVEVNYENNIRYLSIDFIYSKHSDWIKRRQTTFQAFLPKETYRFEKEDDQWIFVGLE